jgi:hypothetical protein
MMLLGLLVQSALARLAANVRDDGMCSGPPLRVDSG